MGALVAELDDVDPAIQGGVHELREIAALGACVGAQVQPRLCKAGADAEAVQSRHVPQGSPCRRARSAMRQPQPTVVKLLDLTPDVEIRARYGGLGEHGSPADRAERGREAPTVEPDPGHAGAGSVKCLEK
ncbi:hypothetical protein GCM10011581_01160 [Saccharopolyspora subtropica]|uniref:Uncharacterized protein n=1 Tax=Saccharopolyspora thermophila TaxID=89367 RepID=A0A917JJ68_9PSEU|nr:hypothetical protein GCM10011581_01160 [Saccharopolyspora subtropica]